MTVIRPGIRATFLYTNSLPPELVEGDFLQDLSLQSELQNLNNLSRIEDYIWDVKQYPTNVKKIYLQGNSTKTVPRQVMRIVTNSFETSPLYFLRNINTTFSEL